MCNELWEFVSTGGEGSQFKMGLDKFIDASFIATTENRQRCIP